MNKQDFSSLGTTRQLAYINNLEIVGEQRVRLIEQMSEEIIELKANLQRHREIVLKLHKQNYKTIDE